MWTKREIRQEKIQKILRQLFLIITVFAISFTLVYAGNESGINPSLDSDAEETNEFLEKEENKDNKDKNEIKSTLKVKRKKDKKKKDGGEDVILRLD